MKKEVYSCLKTLEALNIGVKNMWMNDLLDSADSLQRQYSNLCDILKKHLSTEEFIMVQTVELVDFGESYVYPEKIRRSLLQKLTVSLDMTISFLRSLDMDLNNELIKEKVEIKKQKEELDSRAKQLESIQKTFETLINVLSDKKNGVPELVRSRLMEDIKGSHRGIEKNTNPNTNSQKMVSSEGETLKIRIGTTTNEGKIEKRLREIRSDLDNLRNLNYKDGESSKAALKIEIKGIIHKIYHDNPTVAEKRLIQNVFWMISNSTTDKEYQGWYLEDINNLITTIDIIIREMAL